MLESSIDNVWWGPFARMDPTVSDHLTLDPTRHQKPPGPQFHSIINYIWNTYLRKNTKVNIWTALFRLDMYSPSISIKYETARPYNHGSLQSNW